MAASRSRRQNAGSKMDSLLNKEEEDEFYTTKYGGFKEEEDDIDFNFEGALNKVLKQSPNEVDDEVDSDFSIDENDEPRSDVEEDESGRKKLKRGAGVQTKAYKEPTKRIDKPKDKTPKPKPSKPVTKLSPSDYGRKPTRASTALKTSETIKKIKERDALARRKKLKLKKHNKEYRKLTQEEILAEAKLTEQVNLASLEKYVEMELEAKRRACRTGKRVVQGPAVRYQSVTMPLVETKQEVKEEEDSKPETAMDCDTDDVFDVKPPVEQKETNPVNQGRTFISFTDQETMKNNFNKSSFKIPSVKTCPITRLPAKYFDPVTQLPYANLQAFKILREAYYQQLELKGDRNDPEIAAWLDWRSRNKPVKPVLTSVNRAPPAFSTNPGTAVRPQGQQPQTPKPAPQPPTKQNIVLPTRPVSSIPTIQPAATTTVVFTTTTPTAPVASTPVVMQAVTPATPPVSIQTLKVTATPTASPGTTPRTIATTTLTAAQLQQLAAARGQVFVNQLRAGQMSGGAVRQVSVGQIAGAQMAGTRQIIGRTVAVSGTGPTIMRTAGQGSAGLIVSQQPRHQTVTVQRPQVSQVGVAVGGAGTVSRVTGGRAQVGAGQLVVVTTGAAMSQGGTRQHYVISGGTANSQIVTLTGQSGQTVRAGQIVQVAGQPGQHQIVVSQSGQIVLQPPTTKQVYPTPSQANQ